MGMVSIKRIPWIDCAKGFCMLLVIVGHTSRNSIVKGMIFSFHMPMFFLLSGFTAGISVNMAGIKEKLVKSSKRLLFPAYLWWGIRLLVFFIMGRHIDTIFQIFFSGIMASGRSTVVNDVEIPAMGMPWFLVTLFLFKMVMI